MTNADIIIQRVLLREGGVADVHDGAGITRWGQTGGWLAQYHLPTPTTPDEATANYLLFLSYTHLDAVCAFDLELGDDTVDFAINSGAGMAIMDLQRLLKVTADGKIGPITKAALFACNPRSIRAQLLAEDIELLGMLITRSPGLYAQFAGGWAVRQAEKVRRLG